MLYWLFFELLYTRFSPFRIFGYVTFRTLAASLFALVFSILVGPWMIGKLRRLQIGQYIREEGPESHKKKAGTPTMGGVLIISAVLAPTLLFANLANQFIWIAIFGLLGFGAIGFVDDYAKVKKAQNLGLTARQKLAAQGVMTLILGVWLMLLEANGMYQTAMNVPFFKNVKPDLVIDSLTRTPYTYPLAFVFFFLFLYFVVVGSSNAVNLTDGLDGLASGLMIIAGGAMTILCYVSGHASFANYLGLTRIPGLAELTIFCGALTGACLGFLWYNAHPAEVFMGDVGSLALGGSMGVVAVLIKQEILLLFIGGVYVVELMSVVLQVASFKMTGKRIFLMAPLHHHFEKKGWEESKVIARFWIAGLVMALFALTTLKLR